MESLIPKDRSKCGIFNERSNFRSTVGIVPAAATLAAKKLINPEYTTTDKHEKNYYYNSIYILLLCLLCLPLCITSFLLFMSTVYSTLL
jgi:hypothetical protein